MDSYELRKFKFLRELLNLLEQYGAAIALDSDPDSDLFSVYDTKLELQINGEKVELPVLIDSSSLEETFFNPYSENNDCQNGMCELSPAESAML